MELEFYCKTFKIIHTQVVEGSLAEQCGLHEGDVVVRINNNATIEMTHENAHEELIIAGNEFVLGVLRFFPRFAIISH